MTANNSYGQPVNPIRTDRLLLRRWTESDAVAFEELHRDRKMMFWLGGEQTAEETRGALERLRRHWAEHGWGVRAVCLANGTLIGAAGLQTVKAGMPFTGVEALWRLGSEWWGCGYATEGMRAVLAEGFEQLGLSEILTYTSQPNLRSKALMHRLGFVADPAGDFDHPSLPYGHALRRHVFFRLRR